MEKKDEEESSEWCRWIKNVVNERVVIKMINCWNEEIKGSERVRCEGMGLWVLLKEKKKKRRSGWTKIEFERRH